MHFSCSAVFFFISLLDQVRRLFGHLRRRRHTRIRSHSKYFEPICFCASAEILARLPAAVWWWTHTTWRYMCVWQSLERFRFDLCFRPQNRYADCSSASSGACKDKMRTQNWLSFQFSAFTWYEVGYGYTTLWWFIRREKKRNIRRKRVDSANHEL